MTASAAPRAAGSVAAYAPVRPPRSRFVTVRTLSYHVREWGPADAPPLLLLHGAQDSSASFQFLVDALEGEIRFVAPDWRGHGHTAWTPGNYFQTDFLCDLDALVEALFPTLPAPVVGHSMGANVAALYAGLRPGRVGRLALLDGLGNRLDASPLPIVRTLTNLLDAKAGTGRRSYASAEEMAERLLRGNRRLDAASAAFLAQAHAQRAPDGRVSWPHDPSFRQSVPSLHSTEEWGECWRRIEAPTLLLVSSDPRPNFATSDPDERRARSRYFRDITVREIPETGHNLHHDAPRILARALGAFLGGKPVRLD